jgi:hypothetical protein
MLFWRKSEPTPLRQRKGERSSCGPTHPTGMFHRLTVLLSRVDSVRFLGLSLLYLRACSISKAQLCSQCRNSAIFFALDSVPGFKREFSLADTSYAHNVMSPCYAPADQRASSTQITPPVSLIMLPECLENNVSRRLSSYAVHERVPVCQLCFGSVTIDIDSLIGYRLRPFI